METVKLFTVGFTKKSAERFFSLLQASGARRLIDIRLNNVSQLAGFARRDDLRYFLKALCGMDYLHRTDLAPTKEILAGYRKGGGDWLRYRREFLGLISQRQIETTVSRDLIHNSCLLCSEDVPDHCHRRLVAEYLRDQWGGVEIVHLL
jgi:uncharacterized protein (DUF488 family)